MSHSDVSASAAPGAVNPVFKQGSPEYNQEFRQRRHEAAVGIVCRDLWAKIQKLLKLLEAKGSHGLVSVDLLGTTRYFFPNATVEEKKLMKVIDEDGNVSPQQVVDVNYPFGFENSYIVPTIKDPETGELIKCDTDTEAVSYAYLVYGPKHKRRGDNFLTVIDRINSKLASTPYFVAPKLESKKMFYEGEFIKTVKAITILFVVDPDKFLSQAKERQAHSKASKSRVKQPVPAQQSREDADGWVAPKRR
jgi:hypothetical protein